MSRIPGSDDDADDRVSIGDLQQMFRLGYRTAPDSLHERAWREHVAKRNAEDDRRRRMVDQTVQRLLASATIEQRPCRLCGKLICLVGPKRLPFDPDGLSHMDTCERKPQ